jgi:maleylpyruvate isomerase
MEGTRAAHARLLDDVGRVDDTTARSPSRLPGWSVGHVLTHLARNADSFTRLFQVASRGEVGEQYPGGPEQRARDIEAGAGRAAIELRADLQRAISELEEEWVGASDEVWATGQGSLGRSGVVPIGDVVFRRWVEVEVHHADLGLGFDWDDWSSGFVREELRRREMKYRASQPMGMGNLPREALASPPAQRLAWLLGRRSIDGLPDVTY